MKRILMVVFIAAIGFGFVFNDLPSAYCQEGEFTLEEIIVTAQKREENLQKVAIPMQVFEGSELSETGKNNMDKILENVASVVDF